MEYQTKTELDFILHFLPVVYIREIVIPSTNDFARNQNAKWEDLDFSEFLHLIGILIAMEVYDIHGPRRMYWEEGNGILIFQKLYHDIDLRSYLKTSNFHSTLTLTNKFWTSYLKLMRTLKNLYNQGHTLQWMRVW